MTDIYYVRAFAPGDRIGRVLEDQIVKARIMDHGMRTRSFGGSPLVSDYSSDTGKLSPPCRLVLPRNSRKSDRSELEEQDDWCYAD